MEKATPPLSMRRNCSLDLCLLPPDAPLPLPSSRDEYSMNERSTRNPQQLTIFFGGRICVCDLTEFQARSIILLAKTKMEESMKSPHSEPVTPSLQSQLHSPPGISMKKSLQQFLQRRKNRIQASSPYKR